MDKYKDANGGKDPASIVVFRDGVRGASDYHSVSKEGVRMVLFLSRKGKCSPFLKLTPTPLHMPRDVTNISKD